MAGPATRQRGSWLDGMSIQRGALHLAASFDAGHARHLFVSVDAGIYVSRARHGPAPTEFGLMFNAPFEHLKLVVVLQ